MGTRWKPEEDAILYANIEKGGTQLAKIIPGRSKSAINQRRRLLGIQRTFPLRNPYANKGCYAEQYGRPLTEESAYLIRADYAAKIKRGYTHEKAIDWLVEANMRYRDIIEDVLTNPKYDAEVAVCESRAKYTL